MDTIQHLALAGGLAWASGFRLYAAVFIVGLFSRLGYLQLPDDLELLQHNLVLGVAGVLLVGEFLADKVPAFDSLWDGLHTFIRIPAGALLAWGAFGDSDPSTQLAAGLAGGFISGGTHLFKTGGRAVLNTSPEPFSNWTASFGEDGLLLAGLWLVFAHPLVFLVFLAAFLLLVIWLVPKLFRFIIRVLRRLGGKPAMTVTEPARLPKR
ncbi:MAG: DUF4126 domain-containing protein [Dokdonella sp.]